MFLRRTGYIALLMSGFYSSGAAGAEQASDACAKDLEDIATFLPVNDTGADIAMHHHGAAIDTELQSARKQVADIADNASCDALLRRYLKAWRPGHLALVPWPWNMAASLSMQGKPQKGADPFLAQMKILSKNTVLLTLPTFYDSYESDIKQLLEKNRFALEHHPNWIIDVRKNNGGSDHTYTALLPWLGGREYISWNTEWLATSDNITAQETICSMAGDLGYCDGFIAPVVAALHDTKLGHYTLAKGEEAVIYDRPKQSEKHRPQHVAVLIDRACGSSCEQFLLAARESQSVKLLGRPTSGELDVSNLRPHPLPSGIRAMLYATSRSLRLPDMPIDQIGVQPDILLPRPADDDGDSEMRHVQRWLENGTWK